MRKLTLTAALILATLPAVADTIAGGNAANCSDKNGFYHPTLPDGTVATYWNNPTCIVTPDNDVAEEELPVDETEEVAMK